MTGWHQVWHVSVLAVSLLGGAAVAVLALSALAFDSPPQGLLRARPYLLGLGGAAAGLLAVEWLGVH
ncbi:MAG: hypothetical protein M3323_13665 [Actinomycetota bacterium]|nr:hypothetical protein [Actinomycetota bacterium]